MITDPQAREVARRDAEIAKQQTIVDYLDGELDAAQSELMRLRASRDRLVALMDRGWTR